MKSPSDINDIKLNVIVSVCLVKSSKNGYGNKDKLLLAKLSESIIKKIIISSFITSTEILIVNIKDIVRKTTNNTITTKTTKTESKLSESEVRSFQKASSLIMLHRLPSFCQHKKQQQQHKQQYSNQKQHQQEQQRAQDHCYQQTEEVLASISATGQVLQSDKHQIRRNNNNIPNNNTKSTSVCINYNKNINKSNIIRTEEEFIALLPSTSVSTRSTSITPTITNRLSGNYCIQINNTNNKHRISYRISETKNKNNCHCWNRNQKHRNIFRKNCKLSVVDSNKYRNLFSTTSVKTNLETSTRFNISVFCSSQFSSSFLLLLSLTPSLFLSSWLELASNFKQYTCCFLLSFSSNLILLTKTSLSTLSSSTASASSSSSYMSSLLLNAPKLVSIHV